MGMDVLIAEDDATSRLILQRNLERWGYRVSVVREGSEALRVGLLPEGPALAILDWEMPGLSGLEVCRLLHEGITDRPLYVILLTARNEKADVLACFEAGADDYVSKPFDPDVLRARVEVGRRFVELHRKLLQTQRALEYQAHTDSLTRLPNRRAIVGRLEREISRLTKQDGVLGVGILDIDHFKHINDRHGHLVGDAVLRQVSARAQTALGSEGLVGRFGGEEFLLVLPGVEQARAVELFERVRGLIESEPVWCDGRPVAVTASIGGAQAFRGDEMDDVIHRADKALYRAKGKGRNRVEVSSSSSIFDGGSS